MLSLNVISQNSIRSNKRFPYVAVLLSVFSHGKTWLSLDRFWCQLILGPFINIRRQNSSLVRIGKDIVVRPKYVYNNISHGSSQNLKKKKPLGSHLYRN